MTVVAFELDAVVQVQAVAASCAVETCAVGLVVPASVNGTHDRLVVRDFSEVPENAYLIRSPTSAVLKPSFLLDVVNRARVAGAGVLLAHTHPGLEPLRGFSQMDTVGEVGVADYLSRRLPASAHLAAVFTDRSIHCRLLGHGAMAEIVAVGRNILRFSEVYGDNGLGQEARFDRQVRAFGEEGQSAVRKTRTAIVGLGGTGSIVAQQLAHLGVQDFLLIDPDVVEETNLNRILGATASDVGHQKVVVAERAIRRVNSAASVAVVVGDVVDAPTAKLLIDCDFVFICTDSMASRAVINQLAYQYHIPCIDIGVGIHTKQGSISAVVGRVQMLASGLPCLVCADWLDASQVRTELMNEEQRRRDPYFVGAGVPQPAVISLNGMVTSVAVSIFLSAITSFPGAARMVHYDAVRGSMRPVVMNPRPHCIACSGSGALGRGNTWSLPTRHEHPTK